MWRTARVAFVSALIVVAVVVGALALWKLRMLIALLFFAFVIAAAMRPGVEALARRHVPRSVTILGHYVAILGGLTLLLWLAVPRAKTELEKAVPSKHQLAVDARQSTGVKHDILAWLRDHIDRLPSATQVIHPSLQTGLMTIEIFVGIFFTLAAAAYWIYERDRAVGLVIRLVPHDHRHTVRHTWDLIDAKLGAYVRGQLLLIVVVAAMLSTAFWAIGLPFWLLLGIFGGVVEIVPIIGPLAAGALAVGVGLTVDVRTAALAGAAVVVVRLLEDYVIVPNVLGDAVGLSPLLVLIAATACGLLFGGWVVPLAVPFAAVLGTLFEVIVLDKEPAEQEVPTVLFPAKDAEAAR